ncbi:hypothetical protein BDA96_01G275300 [Sorghum bicolor]|jgi:hypothetical protein|uniref:Uncharacterized protein n=2 Tax=Sorghum bicolor TaxID=4558 RepID=A0A921UZI8_SORBI|nr:hypothetical protein BDA96_01G275300 [Sorghum bicolor]KXG38628.1 hypothetical protein SORBI_3001G259800 [Sorghum bicolor]
MYGSKGYQQDMGYDDAESDIWLLATSLLHRFLNSSLVFSVHESFWHTYHMFIPF